MRTTLPVSLLFVLTTGCTAGRVNLPEPPRKELSMRTYYVAFLRRGPAWTKERTPEAVAASKGHMDNIQRLARCGKLLIAGPFEAGADAGKDALAGLFIFDVPSLEEAEALTRTDPAVQAGRFTVEVKPWFGPTGLTYEGHVPADPDARREP
jgi:uncharacterized protein